MKSDAKHFHPVVAVPARNEAQRLPSLLAALDAQTSSSAPGRPLQVVAVLNNCTDDTRRAALDMARRLPHVALDLVEIDFPPERAHVGSARRLAMDRAFALCPSPELGVILTTDADARPDATWVEANLRAIGRGADLVGGKLIGNAEEEARLGPGFAERAAAIARYAMLSDRLASLVDPLEHDPWPRHRDHTGGSLAIRADVYRAVGGLPLLALREDLGLVSRVRAAGGKLVHPLDVRVEVSARLAGRSPGGMADCLKAWLRAEAEGAPVLVEAPERVEARLLRRRALRDFGSMPTADRTRACVDLAIDQASLRDETGRLVSSCALVERWAPDEPDAPATAAVAAATERILEMIAAIEGEVRAA